jgi:class 3 adenylate cyclase
VMGFKPKHILRWFSSAPLRVKLILTIGLLFIGLMSILSFVVIQQGKNILNERLAETCTMVMRHVSKAIKDDLLLYYRTDMDANSNSLQLGHIRESILSVYSENISGLAYVGVIDRSGTIIAHTNTERLYRKLAPADSSWLLTLDTTMVRERGTNIEYIHPMFTRRENAGDRRIFLGIAVLGFSKEIVMHPIRQVTRAILSATALIIVVSIVIIFVIARRMTAQIEMLGRGLRQVSGGNLNVQIPVLAADELGRLTMEFNAMIVQLREKLQMQKFVSKLTLQMIRSSSNGEGRPASAGQKREITVLFSDVRSFSAMTERLGAEETIKLINIYLDLQARIIEENNGIVDKFMGDQVMAIFLGDRQADTAIHAAVEIQRSIRELNTRRRRNGEVTLQVGCGLHIGEAILGHMGSQDRLDYTVIGEVVNLGSRLCALAKPGQIIVPGEMVGQLNGEYPTIHLSSVQVKGRTQLVEMYEVDYDRSMIV